MMRARSLQRPSVTVMLALDGTSTLPISRIFQFGQEGNDCKVPNIARQPTGDVSLVRSLITESDDVDPVINLSTLLDVRVLR
jgi:hypothetical protein